ncbi:hypothetical protein HKX48_002470 [Thoreauomyces humboldtii]|nr:hypothetical protein HKX48_002470 [Thoreauomyces humboldtii]
MTTSYEDDPEALPLSADVDHESALPPSPPPLLIPNLDDASPPTSVTFLTFPHDVLLLIVAFLPLSSIRTLSTTHTIIHQNLKASSKAVYHALIRRTIDPTLLRCYTSSNGDVPFEASDVDVESRCRRRRGYGKDDPGDPGALYHFLLARQRLVLENKTASGVVERVAKDPCAVRALVALGTRRRERDDGRDDDDGDGNGEFVIPPDVDIPTEALRATLILHRTVTVLKLFGCAAIYPSKSTPARFVGSKFVPWLLDEMKAAQLSAMHWVVVHLDGYSFAPFDTRWRSDNEGFEAREFERVFFRPCLAKMIKDRGIDVEDPNVRKRGRRLT